MERSAKSVEQIGGVLVKPVVENLWVESTQGIAFYVFELRGVTVSYKVDDLDAAMAAAKLEAGV